MDQLTQLYKSRAENLQRQIIILESKLKNIDNLNEATKNEEEGTIIERNGKRYIRLPDGTEMEYYGPGSEDSGSPKYGEVTKTGLVGDTGKAAGNVFANAPLLVQIPVAAVAGGAAALFGAKTWETVVRARHAGAKAAAETAKAQADAETAAHNRQIRAAEAQHAPSYYEGQARQAAGRGAEAEAIGTEAPARAEAERLRQQALADEALQRAAQTEAQEQAITAQEQAKARSEQAKAAKGQVGAKDIADKAKVTALENELDLARARARLQKPGQIPSGPYRNQPGYQDPNTGWWFTKSPDSPRAASGIALDIDVQPFSGSAVKSIVQGIKTPTVAGIAGTVAGEMAKPQFEKSGATDWLAKQLTPFIPDWALGASPAEKIRQKADVLSQEMKLTGGKPISTSLSGLRNPVSGSELGTSDEDEEAIKLAKARQKASK